MSRDVSHPVFSRVYPHLARAAESGGGTEHRRRLLAGLRGRVIEVGAGHGLNFAYYPSTVTEVVAVEPEAHLRKLAQRAGEQASADVRVVDGVAEALPASNGEFDAAVASLVLCSVTDQDLAVAEIRRMLREGGELRFYEHVVALKPGVAQSSARSTPRSIRSSRVGVTARATPARQSSAAVLRSSARSGSRSSRAS